MAKDKRTVENDAYGDMMRRMARAYGNRIAAGDVEDIGKALAVRDYLDQQIADGVARLHDAGESWSRIGRGAGITKQAAAERWGRKATA